MEGTVRRSMVFFEPVGFGEGVSGLGGAMVGLVPAGGLPWLT